MKGTSLVSAECRNLRLLGKLSEVVSISRSSTRVRASHDSSSWRTFGMSCELRQTMWKICTILSQRDSLVHHLVIHTLLHHFPRWNADRVTLRPGNFVLKTSAIACAEKFQCLRLRGLANTVTYILHRSMKTCSGNFMQSNASSCTCPETIALWYQGMLARLQPGKDNGGHEDNIRSKQLSSLDPGMRGKSGEKANEVREIHAASPRFPAPSKAKNMERYGKVWKGVWCVKSSQAPRVWPSNTLLSSKRT